MITLPWRECWGPQLWWWRGPSWLWFSHALLVHSTHAAAAEKMWAQCTHGCYKWSEDTLQVKYDGQRPSSVYSSLLNQRAVTWFVIRVWIRASPYLLKIPVEALAEGSGGGQESCHCGSTALIQNTLQKPVHEEKMHKLVWHTEGGNVEQKYRWFWCYRNMFTVWECS